MNKNCFIDREFYKSTNKKVDINNITSKPYSINKIYSKVWNIKRI